jgi:hypothetical protein
MGLLNDVFSTISKVAQSDAAKEIINSINGGGQIDIAAGLKAALKVGIETAKALLDSAHWTLNREGNPYDPAKDDVRCKMIDGELVALEKERSDSQCNTSSWDPETYQGVVCRFRREFSRVR